MKTNIKLMAALSLDVPARNHMNYNSLPDPLSSAFALIRKEWNPRIAMGGAPVLIHNSQVVCTQQAELCDQFVGNRARTAIGVTGDNKLILLVLDEKPKDTTLFPNSEVEGFSLESLAMVMKSLGCTDAMNLDGGGSTAMVLDGTIINTPSDSVGSRAIPTVLMIKKKK